MSTDDTITVAPAAMVVQRDDAAALSQPQKCLNHLGDCLDFLPDARSYAHCLLSCLYFFFCHAVDNVLLHICCCKCLSSLLKTPQSLEPETCTQKVFAFFVKQLSNLWASFLILLIARLLILRPFDVKPMLGASVVHEFELHQTPPRAGAAVAEAGSPTALELRFNMTPSLLIKSTHALYTIRFNHLAAAAFYAGEKLGPVDDELPPFKQKPHRNAVLDVAIAGRLHNASAAVVKRFAEERVQGRFEVVVTIRTTLTYKFWPYKEDYLYIYECPLGVPVPRGDEPVLWSSPSTCKSVKI